MDDNNDILLIHYVTVSCDDYIVIQSLFITFFRYILLLADHLFTFLFFLFRVFHLYAKLDNENDVPVSLQSIKTIPGSSEETLSFSSSMFLPRFSKVQTFMKAADNSSFEIVANSTITFVLIGEHICFYWETST